MTDIIITIEGIKYKGWTSFNISKTMEALTGSFTLNVTNKNGNDNKINWPLKTQASCIVEIQDELNSYPLITGYIDTVDTSISSEDHSVTVSGRDKTADLVDCSADLIAQKFSFNKVNLLQLATSLSKPFGIKVKATNGTQVSKTFKLSLNTGETIFELLDRKAKETGVLLFTDNSGALVLGNSEGVEAFSGLELGKNLLSGSSSLNFKNRFSEYQVIGQSNQSKDWKANLKIKGTSSDEGVNRYRPLLIQADGEIDSDRAQLEANWEANVRASNSQEFQATVQGFTQENGSPWEVNYLVQFLAPALFIEPAISLLITGVNYVLDDSGSKTILNLKRPDAFQTAPPKIVKAKKEIGFKSVSVNEAQ